MAAASKAKRGTRPAGTLESWLKGDSNVKKRRKSYSKEFKKEVVQCSKDTSVDNASTLFEVNARLIWKWRKVDFECPLRVNSSSGHKQGAGRPCLFGEEQQTELMDMIQKVRDAGLSIARQDVRDWDLIIAERTKLHAYKASPGWLEKF